MPYVDLLWFVTPIHNKNKAKTAFQTKRNARQNILINGTYGMEPRLKT